MRLGTAQVDPVIYLFVNLLLLDHRYMSLSHSLATDKAT